MPAPDAPLPSPPAQSSLLNHVARCLIEAALEAELVEHLGYDKYDASGRSRGSNSRNGSRRKTVRTALGGLEIDVPRDRWGTFEPMTVGKWQRAVVGIDRVLLPLAARDAPQDEVLDLLSRAYPAEASPATLRRIAETARERLDAWHRRAIDQPFPMLSLQLSALRTTHGQRAGFPVASVIGVASPTREDPTRRELLAVHAVPRRSTDEPWAGVLSQLRRRGLRDVRVVEGDRTPSLLRTVAAVWPAARVVAFDRHDACQTALSDGAVRRGRAAT